MPIVEMSSLNGVPRGLFMLSLLALLPWGRNGWMRHESAGQASAAGEDSGTRTGWKRCDFVGEMRCARRAWRLETASS